MSETKTPEADTTTEIKTYAGGCHCGAVRYEATMALSGGAAACNCSICQRAGTLLTFVPDSSFKLLSGQDVLTDYTFGKQRIHHLFCSKCGIKSFARGAKPDGSVAFAVNVRCLDGVELDQVPQRFFDGAKL
jgi:hypothetical protein